MRPEHGKPSTHALWKCIQSKLLSQEKSQNHDKTVCASGPPASLFQHLWCCSEGECKSSSKEINKYPMNSDTQLFSFQ